MNKFEAYLDEMNIVTILVSKESGSSSSHEFLLSDGNEHCKLSVVKKEELLNEIKYCCKLEKDVDLAKQYTVHNRTDIQVTDLLIGSVIRTEKFDQLFFYNGDDLGVTYSKKETTFKVWAPTAKYVTLLLYYSTGIIKQTIPMVRRDRGVWTTTQTGDFEGIFYRFNVCVNNVWREAVDPYVKAISVNGEFGIVIDLNNTKIQRQSNFLPPIKSPTDAIIYETHIRDFSIHPESGIRNKGKYIAFTEEATKGPNDCKTCVDYLVELGITHLELLPFNDFGGVDETVEENQYNWGYNPIHYNVPEGSYATNPYNPYVRIKETKEMIEALHKKGIRIIMDVVYNHIFIREHSSFRKIVPGYYFRYNEFGLPSDGTGVGNDIASERLMVRKFILDSVIFWIKEYNVDGFRFDLMGILDIETMNAIRKAIDKINPMILMIGEGWNLNTPLPNEKKAIIMNAVNMPRIAQFNDSFRDTVKGSIFDLLDQGFISGNLAKKDYLKELMAGSISISEERKGMFESPMQTVNYIECHDNHTLWDKLAISNADESEETRMKRQMLAMSILLLSQGIPFMHSGMEFFRTKYGEGNSYNLHDHINQLDWVRKNMFENYIAFIRTLISIRKAHPAFRLSTSEEIKRHYNWLTTPPNVVGFLLDNLEELDSWYKIMVFFNNNQNQQEVSLSCIDSWNVAVDGDKASLNGLRQVKKKLVIKPLSAVVLYKTKME